MKFKFFGQKLVSNPFPFVYIITQRVHWKEEKVNALLGIRSCRKNAKLFNGTADDIVTTCVLKT
jgi:hypothetical protein